MSDKFIPPHETSCICSCGCFLVSSEPDCPICGVSNPVFGNKSLTELEAEDEEPNDYDDDV